MKTKYIKDHLIQHNKAIQILLKDKSIQDKIIEVVDLIALTFSNANKLMIAGNGGSAADAQHIAAEFIGKLNLKRKALPAIALSTDTSILTSISNDYNFNQIFSRQIEGIGEKGDILLMITTSGNSLNLIEAAKTAKKKQIKVFCFSGNNGGKLKRYCKNIIVNQCGS